MASKKKKILSIQQLPPALMVTIESERLTLKELNIDDITDQYIAWLNDKEVNKYLETRFIEHTRQSCAAYISDISSNPDAHIFGIFVKTSHRHIGNIKIEFSSVRYKVAEIGFFIGEKNQWGKGYGTEAIKSVTRWAFEQLNLLKIEAWCYDVNIASLSCFLKSGYNVEGHFRNRASLNGRIVGAFGLGIISSHGIPE